MTKEKFLAEAKKLRGQIKRSKVKLDTFLLKTGFKFKEVGASYNRKIIFLHPIKKIVVKPYPRLFGNKPKKYVVPTIHFIIKNKKWTIQPLCNTNNAIQACSELLYLVPEWADTYVGNCGYWNNKLAIFDW